jgi:tRNA pseudouridine55 synthase
MDGILLVDKPDGWTSHDIVAKVRNILNAETGKKIKVGHTGTLDPMATGLLVLVIGGYTKRAGEFSKLDKVYEAEITLGATSSTGDKEGEITKVSDKQPEISAVEAVLGRFEGEILQRPHKYSAVKINGQRAYKAARAGKTVEIEPRKVTIYQLLSTNYQYPKLSLTARVSSGTYIRSLAEDIGEVLGTGAYLSTLRRIEVGPYRVGSAVKLGGLDCQTIVKHLAN